MRRGFIRVFRCPKCGRIIRTTAARCKYCAAVIDRVAAEAAADADDKIHAANYEASLITSLSAEDKAPDIHPWVFLFAAPYYIVRWWIRTRRYPQDHPELLISKRSIKRALRLWIPILIGFLIAMWSITRRFREP